AYEIFTDWSSDVCSSDLRENFYSFSLSQSEFQKLQAPVCYVVRWYPWLHLHRLNQRNCIFLREVQWCLLSAPDIDSGLLALFLKTIWLFLQKHFLAYLFWQGVRYVEQG